MSLVRENWISACQFHDLKTSEVLAEVSQRVQKEEKPLILMDLDSTLYEVGLRTHRILLEWTQSSESSHFPQICKELQKLNLLHVGYSLKDTFTALGLSLEIEKVRLAWESAKQFWNQRFFTNEYLQFDRPYLGAVEFTQELYDLGADIVYLTGREEAKMGEGTRNNLNRDHFPLDPRRTHLLLKASAQLSDLEHKRKSANYIQNHGKLVASFENEPPNLVALYGLFPEAMHVFVDTVCSDHPAMACQGLYRISGFKDGKQSS